MTSSWTFGTVSDGMILANSFSETPKINFDTSQLENAIYHMSDVHKRGLYRISEQISSGFSELTYEIETGFRQISEELSRQTELLKGIDHATRNSQQTKAIEWRQMGEELNTKQLYKEAEEFFLKALDAYPLDFLSYVGLAHSYSMQQEFDKAIEILNKSLVHARKTAEFDYKSLAYRHLATAELCKRRTEEALNYLYSCVNLSPNYDKGHYDLSYLLLTLNEKEKAFIELKKSILLNIWNYKQAKSIAEFVEHGVAIKEFLSRIDTEQQNLVKNNFKTLEDLFERAKKAWQARNEYFYDGGKKPYGYATKNNLQPLELSNDSCYLLGAERDDKAFVEILKKAKITRINTKILLWNRSCYKVPVVDFIKYVSDFIENVKNEGLLNSEYQELFDLNYKIKHIATVAEIAIVASVLEPTQFPKQKTPFSKRLSGYPSEVFSSHYYEDKV